MVGNCKPNLPRYLTIQDAANNAASGSTIMVCPGNYPEQVLITKPVTVKGVLVGDAAASVVTAPPGGVTQSTTGFLGNAWAAQILVQNTTGPVNISDLAVDGSNSGITGCPAIGLAGIYYQEASGILNRVTARNQAATCSRGAGIYMESFGPASQAVTVENSSIRGCNGIAIYGDTASATPTLSLTIQNNLVSGEVGPATGIGLGNVTGIVRSNVVNRMFTGILTVHANLTVTSNTVSGDGSSVGAPITVDRDGSTFKLNKVDAAGSIGVMVREAGTSIFQTNTVFNFSTAFSGCTDSFGTPSGYTVSKNTLIDGDTGITMTNANTTVPNTYSSVATPVSPCS